MRIIINGEAREFPEPLNLLQLVEHIGAKPDRVALELNRNIVARDQWRETNLQHGDRLEMVHFVGGG